MIESKGHTKAVQMEIDNLRKWRYAAAAFLCLTIFALALYVFGLTVGGGYYGAHKAPHEINGRPVLVDAAYSNALMRGIYTVMPHDGSPAYNGADTSYLQDSCCTADSVLSACNMEFDGKDVKAQGYNRNTDQYFSVWDNTADGTCEANWTGQNLEWHHVKEEGSDYGAKSWH